NCVVLDAVESFPASQVHASSKPATTVLVLPARAIAASQTRSGDQMIRVGPEEMKGPWRAQGTAFPAQPEPAPENSPAPIAPVPEPQTVAAGQQKSPKAKSWLQRLLSPEPPEPRKALREALPWVAAYFFTGGTPV